MGDHTLRLGKTMGFISADGAEHVASFWCLERLATEIGDRSLRLRFIGYHSAAAYDADRQPVASAVKEYLISGEAFMAAISLTTAAADVPISAEIIRLAWAVAAGVADTADPENEGEFISFFDSAEDAA
ncbi:MAG TPA: hypothetical protein VIW64_08805 [Pyrinomonadaceae bacterium]|jgi:hypothetical protein